MVELLLRRIPELVRAEACGFNVVDVRAQHIEVQTHPNVPQFTTPAQNLSAVMGDHPLISHWFTQDDPTPRRVSDVAAIATWRSTLTYSQVLRPMGTPHMIAIPTYLSRRTGRGEGYALVRSGRDFTDTERDVASALQIGLLAVHRPRGAVMQRDERPCARSRLVSDSGTGGRLTPREHEVLELLCEGLTAFAMASRLGIGPMTVRKHLENLYKKLGVNDRCRRTTPPG